MGPIQDMAMRSMSWFEDVDERMDRDPVRIAYSLFDRRGDQAPWRYQLHLATQIEPLRQVRTGLTTARRSVRSMQRTRRAGAGGAVAARPRHPPAHLPAAAWGAGAVRPARRGPGFRQRGRSSW